MCSFPIVNEDMWSWGMSVGESTGIRVERIVQSLPEEQACHMSSRVCPADNLVPCSHAIQLDANYLKAEDAMSRPMLLQCSTIK